MIKSQSVLKSLGLSQPPTSGRLVWRPCRMQPSHSLPHATPVWHWHQTQPPQLGSALQFYPPSARTSASGVICRRRMMSESNAYI